MPRPLSPEEHAQQQIAEAQVRRYRDKLATLKGLAQQALDAIDRVPWPGPFDQPHVDTARRILRTIIHGERGEPSRRALQRKEKKRVQRDGRR